MMGRRSVVAVRGLVQLQFLALVATGIIQSGEVVATTPRTRTVSRDAVEDALSFTGRTSLTAWEDGTEEMLAWVEIIQGRTNVSALYPVS